MKLLQYYVNLLNKLHIYKPNEVSRIMTSDNYENCTRRFSIKSDNVVEQIGGNDSESIEYSFRGYNFIIYKSVDEYSTDYAIHDKSNEDNPEMCMWLSIYHGSNGIEIKNVSYFKNCAINGMPKTRGGSLMLQMTLYFIDNELKEKYKLVYAYLKDNSFFQCHNMKIELDSMSMLSRGHTWYGKYGFVPYDSHNETIDKVRLKGYHKNQYLVYTTLVKDTNIRKYFIDGIKKLDLTNLFPPNKVQQMFKEYDNLPILVFFKDLLDQYSLTCAIFDLMYKQVMFDIGMEPIHGKSYMKYL